MGITQHAGVGITQYAGVGITQYAGVGITTEAWADAIVRSVVRRSTEKGAPMPAILDERTREKRDDALAQLHQLAKLRGALEDVDGVAKELRARRLRLWIELAQMVPAVSWTDLSRASGVTDVTIHQAVKGRKQA